MTQPTVLLVEADVLVRYPLAHYLRECGYRVVEAVNADEARALVDTRALMPSDTVISEGGSESAWQIDIVLIDAMSAPDSGFPLARWLRETHPEIQVSLTGNVNMAMKEARELCADGPALTKPYDHQAVLHHIKSLLAARERARGKTAAGKKVDDRSDD